MPFYHYKNELNEDEFWSDETKLNEYINYSNNKHFIVIKQTTPYNSIISSWNKVIIGTLPINLRPKIEMQFNNIITGQNHILVKGITIIGTDGTIALSIWEDSVASGTMASSSMLIPLS